MNDKQAQAEVLDAAEQLLLFIENCRLQQKTYKRFQELVGNLGTSFTNRVALLKAEQDQLQAEIRRLRLERGLQLGPKM